MKADSPAEIAMTVTWLALQRRPDPVPPRPAIPNLSLLTLKRPPLAFYRFLIDQVGGDRHWISRFVATPERLEKLHDPARNTIQVLYLDGAPAGFYELDHCEAKRTHLVHFGLLGNARGLKLSPWLLATALNVAWRGKIEQITVGTTSLDHPAALRLYQQAGFTVYNREMKRIRPLSDTERCRLLLEGQGEARARDPA